MSLVAKPVSPLAIANYFLRKAWKEGRRITPMKLQKLVYYAHGWHLGLYGKPLIDAPIEAWQYGPVIPELYREFRRFGNEPIDSPATVVTTRLELEPASIAKDDSPRLEPFLNRIWDQYGGFTAVALSNMTHRPGTPWYRVYKQHNDSPPPHTEIPNDLIKECFVGRQG